MGTHETIISMGDSFYRVLTRISEEWHTRRATETYIFIGVRRCNPPGS